MLLQYPKVGSTTVAHYEDYRQMHHEYISIYKTLYEDVAGFSMLPERFIKDAEPVIERYLNTTPAAEASAERKLQLQGITDFITRFYDFMDDATNMFVEHQALSDKTINYMEFVSELNRKNDGKNMNDCEIDYVRLMPELEELNENLINLRIKVDTTSENLDDLKPLWDKIRDKIQVAG